LCIAHPGRFFHPNKRRWAALLGVVPFAGVDFFPPGENHIDGVIKEKQCHY